MRTARRFGLGVVCTVALGAGLVHSASHTAALNARSDEPGNSPALTIYNQKFAVIREMLPLDLKAGANHVEVNEITGHLEPDSVILRPLDGSRRLQVLEQNYRNDPVTQELLLSLYEGKTIDFQVGQGATIQGKIIRSGFVPHSALAYQYYGQDYRFA
ncbi:MAG TPA: hypothetical protein VJW93_10285, partial [Candidatus Acidoferrales bacterium]|nr:hypothetical protein [Candidatus Acidoferrales bacterium]